MMNQYIRIASSLFIVSLLVSSGCTSVEHPTSEFCPKHGNALQTRTAYKISQDVLADPTRSYIRVAKQYPMHTPWIYSEKLTDIHKDREKVSFCPRCDAELKNALRE
jgi:hypothetical protein